MKGGILRLCSFTNRRYGRMLSSPICSLFHTFPCSIVYSFSDGIAAASTPTTSFSQPHKRAHAGKTTGHLTPGGCASLDAAHNPSCNTKRRVFRDRSSFFLSFNSQSVIALNKNTFIRGEIELVRAHSALTHPTYRTPLFFPRFCFFFSLYVLFLLFPLHFILCTRL